MLTNTEIHTALALRAALAVARAVRNQCLRDYNASQREVTHLRLALAKAEKAAREEEKGENACT